jgi:microcystin-dependent protein
MDAYIGTILAFAFPRVPTGWHACDGSMLDISQNQALYAIIGTTYGGDGIRTFALPDLRGRVPIHTGQGSGLSSRPLGLAAGSESVTLQLMEYPQHSHNLVVTSNNQTANAGPTQDAAFGVGLGGATPYVSDTSGAPVVMNAHMVSPTQGGGPHNNLMPSLVLNYCIAMVGIFPTPN